MRKPTIECALLAALIAKHCWGTPINETNLLAVAAIESHEYGAARDSLADLRSEPYVIVSGGGSVKLDNDAFGSLAEVLYQDCGWEPFQIKSRLKHYEGWERHDWA